jgi:hypothetical protein
MNLMAKLRHRLYGHLFHGQEIAAAYQRQPDGTMGRSGFTVHMRCVRTGCDYLEKRQMSSIPRPKTDPVVSLLTDNEE